MLIFMFIHKQKENGITMSHITNANCIHEVVFLELE